MKVIFLDIDGVLVTSASWGQRRPYGHAPADDQCVMALNRIIALTGAEIVVSSTWRIGTSVAELREILNIRFGVTGRVIDKTPRLTTKRMFEGQVGQVEVEVAAERGDEIAAWLRGYQRHPVDSFVILDDDPDMGKLAGRLVKTNFQHGLTETDADRAIDLLGASCGVAA